MRTVLLIFACLTFFISAHSQSARPDSRALTRDEKWRQDLQYLATELAHRHKNLFAHLKKADLEQSVARLDRLIPTLNDQQIILELMRIMASIGDAHTDLRWQFRSYYPLGLLWLEDGLYLMRTSADYKQYLGMRLIRIGNTDLKQAYRTVAELIPHENESWLLMQSPTYLVTPEILQGIGILPQQGKGRFVLQDAKGHEFAVDFNPLTTEDKVDWVLAVDAIKLGAPLYRQKPQLNYWYEYLADSRTLYIKYNRCRDMDQLSFKQFNEQVWDFLTTHPVERFVVDLRNNGGGDSSVFAPMLTEVRRRSEINRRGHLFVIIGRGTFSSGYLNAWELKQQTAAILVGEPTGQKPNAYGEVRSFKLPHSGLDVDYSTKYFRTTDGDPKSLMPDITVEITSTDYLAARDPVLAKILAYH